MSTFKKSIYVVEDDPTMSLFLTNFLEKHYNVKVFSYFNAETCIMDLEGTKPDLILMDYYLDSEESYNINGHQAYSIIKEKDPQQEILFMTSSKNNGMMKLYRKCLAIDCLFKESLSKDYVDEKLGRLIA